MRDLSRDRNPSPQPPPPRRGSHTECADRSATRTTQGLHSGLIFAALTTPPHFSVSSAMTFPNSAGEPASTVPPISLSRSLILGSAKAALISRLRRSTMSGGVLAGGPTPYQALASKPGTKSFIVGRAGGAAARVGVRPRQCPHGTRPDVTDCCGNAVEHDLDLARDQVGEGRSLAAVRHVHDFGPGHH